MVNCHLLDSKMSRYIGESLKQKLELNENMRIGFLYDSKCKSTKIRTQLEMYTVRYTPPADIAKIQEFVKQILKADKNKCAPAMIDNNER